VRAQLQSTLEALDQEAAQRAEALKQVETLTSALAALKAARMDSDSLDIELTSGQELVNIEGGGEDGQATRLVHALAVEVVALREDNVEKEVLLLGLQDEMNSMQRHFEGLMLREESSTDRLLASAEARVEEVSVENEMLMGLLNDNADLVIKARDQVMAGKRKDTTVAGLQGELEDLRFALDNANMENAALRASSPQTEAVEALQRELQEAKKLASITKAEIDAEIERGMAGAVASALSESQAALEMARATASKLAAENAALKRAKTQQNGNAV